MNVKPMNTNVRPVAIAIAIGKPTFQPGLNRFGSFVRREKATVRVFEGGSRIGVDASSFRFARGWIGSARAKVSAKIRYTGKDVVNPESSGADILIELVMSKRKVKGTSAASFQAEITRRIDVHRGCRAPNFLLTRKFRFISGMSII